jgi:Zn-dependent protease with chaperone function
MPKVAEKPGKPDKPAEKKTEKVRFPGISPTSIEHPLDRSALEVLRKTPGLDTLFKKLASLHFERQVRLYYTADTLRLTPKQCPDVYALFREACEILDMEEPELYLAQAPIANAFAIGFDRHTVVITSGLVDLLTPEELQGVMGHELGHIKSGHMLYRTIAAFLSLIGLLAARNLPFVNLLTQALIYALYDWTRKSELTADRAGLLVSQNPDVAVSTLLKLAGGSQHTALMLNREEFLKQADDYEDMDESFLNVIYKFEMTRYQTHPFPALRAREISRWSETDDYRRILAGGYDLASGVEGERRCTTCGATIENPTFRFCTDCGKPLDPK